MASPVQTTIDPWSSAATPPTNWARLGGFSADCSSDGAGHLTGANGLFSADYYSSSTFGPDVDVWTQHTTYSAGAFPALFARLANPGSGSTLDGYQLYIDSDGSTWHLRRIDNNVYTVLANGTKAVATGDYFWLNIAGSTVTAYWSSDGSTWTQVIQTTDATYTAAGNIGCQINGNTEKFGAVKGGTIVTVPVSGGPVRIPNRFVGPMALRQQFRRAYWPQASPPGAPQQIVPAGINATSSITATLSNIDPITPAGINATSAVAGAIVAERAVTPAAVNATSTISATLQLLHLLPAGINATSTVTGTVTGGTTATVWALWSRLRLYFESVHESQQAATTAKLGRLGYERLPVDEQIDVYGLPAKATGGTFYYVVVRHWDTGDPNIVTEYVTVDQAEANAVLLDRVQRGAPGRYEIYTVDR